MSGKYKSSRTLRSELLSFALVALVPLGIACVFPYGVVGYKFSRNLDKSQGFASFVFLSETEEREAIVRSRNAWQLSSRVDTESHLELSMDDLPELPPAQLLEQPIIHSEAKEFGTIRESRLYPPSVAAPERVRTKSEGEGRTSEKYFSDEDLMKLK